MQQWSLDSDYPSAAFEVITSLVFLLSWQRNVQKFAFSGYDQMPGSLIKFSLSLVVRENNITWPKNLVLRCIWPIPSSRKPN